MREYKLKDTPSGKKTLLYVSGREIRIHSAHDPEKDAKRSVDSFEKGRANLIVVCGIGLGYHIKLLKNKYPECTLLAIDRDSETLKLTRKHCPHNLDGVRTAISHNDLPLVFEELDISSVKGVSTYYHRPSYLIAKEFYDGMLKNIKEYISSKVSDLLTRFEFEEKWFENMLKNAHHIYTSTPVSELFGRFSGYPGIIVSAGPSLRKNVKKLSALRDRALIVCVDTALKVLLRNNIEPHIVMTLDSQKYSIKHFLGVKNHKAALIADVVSFPGIIKTYSGKKIISTTSKFYTDSCGEFKRETTPLWDWMESFTGPVGDIQSGGSVATSAFDLLLNLGCSPIVLIGQDLAYTGREIHCSGTYHNDDWIPGISRFRNLESINQDVIRKRKIKRIEAFGGMGTVISDFVFDIYRSWFEDSAGKVAIPVINATEGGAKILNTRESSVEELAAEFKIPPKIPDDILAPLVSAENRKDPRSFLNELIRASAEIKNIKTLAEKELEKELPDERVIFAVMEKKNISIIIKPFLRKTSIYISRHENIKKSRAGELLLTGIISSANKLLNLIELSKKNLQKYR